jgi:transglutaminase-like putative cysteine protease
MYKLLLSLWALTGFPFALLAQDEDKNIVIESAREEYRYVKGNSANPVRIRQELTANYLCTEYRTDVPVAEFYNDQIELNDVDVRINGDKVKNFKPNHDYYSSDGIFYSDARICYFSLPLEKKDTRSQVRFSKTVLDPRYFTSIYFTEPYRVQQKEVVIIVPRWMKIEIREYNFAGYSITKKTDSRDGENIYTYTITNAQPLRSEANAPGFSHIAPHLLVMSKYAEPDGQRITYFNTLDDQYKWYRSLVKQIGNEPAAVKAKAEEITKGLSDDVEKVKAIFQWVQDHIRYIAFEDGIAGFRPEKAQEVLRKKYGDCKGMGNLMAEMLKSIGLDGRLCWLGTNHIAYDYSTPSLGVDNHMICAWMYKGKTYYLDATEKYIGFNEIAERIQGRQVLIEDGDKYLVRHIPVASQSQNTSYEKRVLKVAGNNLVGRVTQVWKGESKEWMLSALNSIKKNRQEDALREYLAKGNAAYQISNLKIINLNDYNADLKIEYDVVFRDAVSAFDKESYIDLDNRKDYGQFRFDESKRKLPYQFPYKDHMIFETELELPANAKVSALPAAFKLQKPLYDLSGQWSVSGNKVIYKREIQLKNTLLKKEEFAHWNADLEKLNEFYNTQLAITQ